MLIGLDWVCCSTLRATAGFNCARDWIAPVDIDMACGAENVRVATMAVLAGRLAALALAGAEDGAGGG